MFIHNAGAERFAFHNGSSIRQVVIFVSHRLSITAIHEMNDGIRYILTNVSPRGCFQAVLKQCGPILI
jgi:hypothetical protein